MCQISLEPLNEGGMDQDTQVLAPLLKYIFHSNLFLLPDLLSVLVVGDTLIKPRHLLEIAVTSHSHHAR